MVRIQCFRLWQKFQMLECGQHPQKGAGELEIKISNDETSACVDVINEGMPISDEEKDRIFRKFYQCDKSHASEGNGIGLAIVKRIVDLHGGKIDVSSHNGRNIFSIKIPKV